MRINDKHLVAFASSNSPVDKEGYLLKRGEVNKAYQKRWFVLKGNLLFYYEKKGDREPIGVIILEGCTVELAEMTEAYTFELVFQGSGSRTYILSAECQEEMEAWMKVITSAGYEYMKLMVSELQRQLDELQMTPAGAPWNRSATNTIAKAVQQQQSGLIDLSIPDSAQTSRPGRFNPFNSGGAMASQDGFGAVPFEANFGQSQAGPRARTFDEMHEEFGLYIRQKSHRDSQTEKDPLQDAPLLDLS